MAGIKTIDSPGKLVVSLMGIDNRTQDKRNFTDSQHLKALLDAEMGKIRLSAVAKESAAAIKQMDKLRGELDEKRTQYNELTLKNAIEKQRHKADEEVLTHKNALSLKHAEQDPERTRANLEVEKFNYGKSILADMKKHKGRLPFTDQMMENLITLKHAGIDIIPEIVDNLWKHGYQEYSVEQLNSIAAGITRDIDEATQRTGQRTQTPVTGGTGQGAVVPVTGGTGQETPMVAQTPGAGLGGLPLGIQGMGGTGQETPGSAPPTIMTPDRFSEMAGGGSGLAPSAPAYTPKQSMGIYEPPVVPTQAQGTAGATTAQVQGPTTPPGTGQAGPTTTSTPPTTTLTPAQLREMEAGLRLKGKIDSHILEKRMFDSSPALAGHKEEQRQADLTHEATLDKQKPEFLKIMDRFADNAQSGDQRDVAIFENFLSNHLNKGLTEGNAYVQTLEWLSGKNNMLQKIINDPKTPDAQKDALRKTQSVITLGLTNLIRNPEKFIGKTEAKGTTGSRSKTGDIPRSPVAVRRDGWVEDTSDAKYTGDHVQKINTNPLLFAIGENMKLSYKAVDSGWWFFDKQIGPDPKNQREFLDFSANFLNNLISEMRKQGYTPSDAMGAFQDLDHLASFSSGEIKGQASIAEKIVHTYRNVNHIYKELADRLKGHVAGLAAAHESSIMASPEKYTNLSVGEVSNFSWDDFDQNWANQFIDDTQPRQPGQPGPGQPGWELPKVAPKKGGTYKTYDTKTKQYKEIKVDQVVTDANNKVLQIDVNGERIKPPGYLVKPGADVLVPESHYKNLPKGTPLIINGKRYRLQGMKDIKTLGMTLKRAILKDQQGGTLKQIDLDMRVYLPGHLRLSQINKLLTGNLNRQDIEHGIRNTMPFPKESSPPSNRSRATPPIDPNKPIVPKKSSDGTQKKNEPPVKGGTLSTMTWETFRNGDRLVKLDSKGRAFATLLNHRKPGEKRKGSAPLSGAYDGDTLHNVVIAIPDTNFDGVPDDMVELEGGGSLPLDDAWKWVDKNKDEPRKYTTDGKGVVYTHDTNIRLAGYNAAEIYLNKEDEENGELNPAGVAAQEALVRMLRGGWVDQKDKDRFNFKVLVAGTPRNHKSGGTYLNHGRVVTDVYVAFGAIEKKIGSVIWVNPVDQLVEDGFGTEWYPRSR